MPSLCHRCRAATVTRVPLKVTILLRLPLYREWPLANLRARHLTPKQRIHILRRDGYRCQWHVHHLTYDFQYGTTTPDNLITLCASCHRLEVAECLDWFLGWPGSQDHSHRARVQGRPLQLTG